MAGYCCRSSFVSVLFVVFFIAFIPSGFGLLDCGVYTGNQSACTVANVTSFCQWSGSPNNICDERGCWSFPSSATCTNASNLGLPCSWNSQSSFCSEAKCWDFQGTNQTNCQNSTLGSALHCQWNNTTGGTFCSEPRRTCADYNNKKTDCFNTFHCAWNATSSVCSEPPVGSSGSGGGSGGGFSPGCGTVRSAGLCNNMSGVCTWANGTCGGIQSGLGCTNVNNSDLCNSVPLFSTCCGWNSNVCNTTFSTSCWDNMQATPTGASFCDDFKAVQNQTLCNQISGSPWYMPCKWDNKSTNTVTDDHCTFDGAGLFSGGGATDKGKFTDIGSQQSCEAAGGIWKTESFVSSSGSTQNSQWCEMKFGFGAETCDSSCWACEKQTNGTVWSTAAAAQTACEASRLGFCKWRNATTSERPPNGLGFCEKPAQLMRAGCGSKTQCGDYEFYSNPSTACDDDEDCKWLINPSNASLGSCVKANTKTCDQSCGQCGSQTACQTNGTNCEWDGVAQLCKSRSSSGSTEICFNGIDDDGDGAIDCADTNCVSDSFCGGGSGYDCSQFTVNATCTNNSAGNCAWVNDSFSNRAWCDLKGANCWQADGNEVLCNATLGCSWSTTFFGGGSATCEVNDTFYLNTCGALNNQFACTGNGNCTWATFGGSNFCMAKPFNCWSYRDQNACNNVSNSGLCGWVTDPMAPGGGRCDASCFGLTGSSCTTNTTIACKTLSGLCQPQGFSIGGCGQFDGSRVACQAKDKCQWIDDPSYDNVTGNKPNKGWCNDKSVNDGFAGMQGGQPTIIATDADGCSESGVAPQSDICGVGIKEMPDAYGFGVKVNDAGLARTMMCNGKALTNGTLGNANGTASFYLYLDTDGKTTGGCNATNTTNKTGYDFFFKYETSRSSTGQLTETKISYSCLNGLWSTQPIPFSSWPQMACKEFGAAILAINKETLQRYTSFNISKPIRVFAVTSNTTNANAHVGTISVQDSVGPGYYSSGTVDFIAEDCKGLVDKDGDGCLPSEDPDCMMYNKLGYIPFEDCYNNIDDNGDGLVDCSDPQCKYDQFHCGGSFVADPNDVTPPALADLQIEAYPEGATVKVNSYEPSNASLTFYRTSASCSSANATITDGRFVSWHALPLHNLSFNSQRLSVALSNGTTYFLKYTLCDVSGNCLASGCTNFTTPSSYTDCGRSCNTFLDPMDFTPPTGTNTTSPLGNLTVRYDFGSDGSYDVNKTYGDSSTQQPINETQLVTINLTNPSSSEPWGIVCENGTVPSSISFNASALIANGSSANGTGLVGMPTAEYTGKFITEFGCKKIMLTIPNNGTDLFHCTNTSVSNLTECTNVTSSSTLVSSTNDSSTWEVDPKTLGFSYYGVTGSPSTSSGSSGGSGGGGSSSNATTSCTEEWSCTSWYACSAAGKKIRTCIDLKSCGTTTLKPSVSETCTPPVVEAPPATNTSGTETNATENLSLNPENKLSALSNQEPSTASAAAGAGKKSLGFGSFNLLLLGVLAVAIGFGAFFLFHRKK
ncbi:hypothetical protein HZB02_04000 [Candidatus Woesearchaeota archaeon]|nr:hypothetical protein [Candidatus Woesearchaeota archaeon]